mgnify:CR=1 FL=1
MEPTLKSFALVDINTDAVYTAVAADIIVAAMQVDENAGGEQELWYREVPNGSVHEFLTEATAGYTVYHAPNGWEPTNDDHKTLSELLAFSVAGYVEITPVEGLE